MSDNYFEIEVMELRKKIQLLTEENKCLKQKLKNLLEDSTGNNLQLLKNIVLNYYDDLGGSIPIVMDKGDRYKLGAAIIECSIKQLKEWGPDEECDQLNGYEDNTKVLLIC